MRLGLPGSTRPVGKPTNRAFIVGVGFLGMFVAVALAYIGFEAPNHIPGRSYFTIRGQFAFADNITPHSEVRVGGRLVGQVLNPRVKDGKAVVDLQLDPAIKPIRSDTRLAVRPKSAVGVRYIDMTLGTRGQPLTAGQMIPASQTGSPVELDQVLNSLDSDTRARTQTMIRELGTGAAGRGDDMNAGLAVAPHFLRGLGSVATTMHRGDIHRFVTSAEAAASAVAPVSDTYAQGFTPEARAMRPFWRQGDDLRSTLDTAPPALRATQAGLAATDPLLTQVGGFAREGRPTLAALPDALGQTTRMLRTAKAPLRQTDETLDLTSRAVPPTVALLRRLGRDLPDLDQMLRSALPIASALRNRGCDIHAFASGWGDMDSWGNSVENFLRLEAHEGAVGPIEHLPPLKSTRYQTRYEAPCAEKDMGQTPGGGASAPAPAYPSTSTGASR